MKSNIIAIIVFLLLIYIFTTKVYFGDPSSRKGQKDNHLHFPFVMIELT